MPNFLKKASKRTNELCGEDEAALAALFVRPTGEGNAKRLGAPGGALGKMSPLADQVAEVEAGGRASVFGQNAVLVLTDHRILVFGHGSLIGRVRKLVGEVDLADIAELSLDTPDDDGLVTLAIRFNDGEVVNVAPGSRRSSFIEAFDSAKQPA